MDSKEEIAMVTWISVALGTCIGHVLAGDSGEVIGFCAGLCAGVCVGLVYAAWRYYEKMGT